MRWRLYLIPFIVAGRRSTTSPPIRPSLPLVGHPGGHRPCQTSKSSARCQGSSISQVPSSNPYQLIQYHHPLAVGTGARENKNNMNWARNNTEAAAVGEPKPKSLKRNRPTKSFQRTRQMSKTPGQRPKDAVGLCKHLFGLCRKASALCYSSNFRGKIKT